MTFIHYLNYKSHKPELQDLKRQPFDGRPAIVGQEMSVYLLGPDAGAADAVFTQYAEQIISASSTISAPHMAQAQYGKKGAAGGVFGRPRRLFRGDPRPPGARQ